MKVAVTSTVVLDVPDAPETLEALDTVTQVFLAANRWAIGRTDMQTYQGMRYVMLAIEQFKVEKR